MDVTDWSIARSVAAWSPQCSRPFHVGVVFLLVNGLDSMAFGWSHVDPWFTSKTSNTDKWHGFWENFYFYDGFLLSMICVVGFFFTTGTFWWIWWSNWTCAVFIAQSYLPKRSLESPASLLGPICWNSYLPENMAGWKTHHEWVDVFPIEHGDFPASHVSELRGVYCHIHDPKWPAKGCNQVEVVRTNQLKVLVGVIKKSRPPRNEHSLG